ncbi:MAG: hypothetical protein WC451_06235 [Patescibacteria group bacterium]
MIRLFFIFSILLIVISPQTVEASQAALVIKSLDGTEKSFCLDFNEQSISGLDLLKRNQLNPILDNGFLIEISEERAKSGWGGNAYDDYWSYWQNQNGSWVYSRAGAQYSKIIDGSLWGWQRGDSNLKISNYSFSLVCPEKTVLKDEGQNNPVADNLKSDNVPITEDSQPGEIQPEKTKEYTPKNQPDENSIAEKNKTESVVNNNEAPTSENNVDQGKVAGATDNQESKLPNIYYLILLSGGLFGVLASIAYIKLFIRKSK